MKVIVSNKNIEYRGFFTLEKSTLQFEKLDGSLSEHVIRENFYRGDSVSALVYDSKVRKILFVRQFRYPVYTVEPENSWILELVAGSCNRGEDPAETMARELSEEVHIESNKKDIVLVSAFFVSPDGTSEKIYLYSVETDLSGYNKNSGGLDEENEDIEIILLSFDEAFSLLETQKFYDAKTIIALQHLRLNVVN